MEFKVKASAACIDPSLNYAWCYFCSEGVLGKQKCNAFIPFDISELRSLKEEFDTNTGRAYAYFERGDRTRFKDLVPTVYNILAERAGPSLDWPE
jgi:hypothetical protein